MIEQNHTDTRLKRLRFRSWHRGCKETDLLLGRFCDARLHSLSEQEITVFEALLEEEDADIWQWLSGKQPVPEAYAILIESIVRNPIQS